MKRIFISFFFFNLFLNLFAQREHIIQKGETIESVAKKYGLRVDELQDANPIAIKYFYVNTPLVIPQHVPTAEEIRMQEEATERYLARQRQEAEEKAAKKARKREFWGNVFGSLAQGAIIGMNSYYSNTTSMGNMYFPTYQSNYGASEAQYNIGSTRYNMELQKTQMEIQQVMQNTIQQTNMEEQQYMNSWRENFRRINGRDPNFIETTEAKTNYYRILTGTAGESTSNTSNASNYNSNISNNNSSSSSHKNCSICHGSGWFRCPCESAPSFGLDQGSHKCTNCGEIHRKGSHMCKCRN